MQATRAIVSSLFATLYAVSATFAAFGSSPQEAEYRGSRQALDDEYLGHYQTTNVIYESAPVTHVVPSYKTISFALAGEHIDTSVESTQFVPGSNAPFGLAHRLEMSGYRFAPYVAVSLKRIGLGFSAEAGQRALDYRIAPSALIDDRNRATRHQRSEVDYRAIGVYAYLLPFDSGGKRRILASVVLGAKDYNVNHRVSPLLDQQSQLAEHSSKYRYNVTELEAGALLEFRLFKNFSIVPWADYVYTDTRDPVTQANDLLADEKAYGDKRNTAAFLKADSELMWRARPRLDYGIDMVVKAYGFAVHIGDLFGALVSQSHPDSITDKNYVLRLSFDMKGQ